MRNPVSRTKPGPKTYDCPALYEDSHPAQCERSKGKDLFIEDRSTSQVLVARWNRTFRGEKDGWEQAGRFPELVGRGRKAGRFTGKLTTEAGQGRTGSEPGIQAGKNRWKVVYSTE